MKEEAHLAAVGPLDALGPAIAINDAGDVAQTVGNFPAGTNNTNINIGEVGVQDVQDASTSDELISLRFQLSLSDWRLQALENFIHAHG